MAKRNSKGQFVKGSGGSKKSTAKKTRAKKGGGSIESRVSRLEHNQKLIVGVVDGMEARLTHVEDAVGQLAGAMGARFKRTAKKPAAKKPAAKKKRTRKGASAGV